MKERKMLLGDIHGELEKLEKADAEGRNLGISFNTGTRHTKTGDSIPTDGGTTNTGIVNPNNSTGADDEPPPILTTPKSKTGDNTITKPPLRPSETPKKVETPKEEKKPPEGNKKKGKKGDIDP